MRFYAGNKILSIGYSLKGELSGLLQVSKNQIVLPERFSKTRISYIYKTKERRNDSVLLNLILDKLNLQYKIIDTLTEVMQLEVVDKGLLEKFADDEVVGMVSRTSTSNTYIGISKGLFSSFKSEIEGAFNTIVILKDEKNFDKKVSVTIRRDSLDRLKESLKTYGIEVSFVKIPLKAYRFQTAN